MDLEGSRMNRNQRREKKVVNMLVYLISLLVVLAVVFTFQYRGYRHTQH